MKSRLITKKPQSDQKLNFMPMGHKPSVKAAVSVTKKPASKNKKINRFAKKAAAALSSRG